MLQFVILVVFVSVFAIVAGVAIVKLSESIQSVKRGVKDLMLITADLETQLDVHLHGEDNIDETPEVSPVVESAQDNEIKAAAADIVKHAEECKEESTKKTAGKNAKPADKQSTQSASNGKHYIGEVHKNGGYTWMLKENGKEGWVKSDAEKPAKVKTTVKSAVETPVEEKPVEQTPVETKNEDKPETDKTKKVNTANNGKHAIGEVHKSGKFVWKVKENGAEGWVACEKQPVEKTRKEKTTKVETKEVEEKPQTTTEQPTKSPKAQALDAVVAKMEGAEVTPVKAGVVMSIGKSKVEVVKVENFADGLQIVVKNEGGVEKAYKASAVFFSVATLTEIANGIMKKSDKGSTEKGATKATDKLDAAKKKVEQKKEELKEESKKSDGTLISDETHAEMKKIAGGIAKTMLNKKMKSVDIDIKYGTQDSIIKSVDLKESGLALTIKKGNTQRVFNVEFLVDKKSSNVMNIETLKTIQRMVNECAGKGKKTA